jgi:hypothetical protein
VFRRPPRIAQASRGVLSGRAPGWRGVTAPETAAIPPTPAVSAQAPPRAVLEETEVVTERPAERISSRPGGDPGESSSIRSRHGGARLSSSPHPAAPRSRSSPRGRDDFRPEFPAPIGDRDAGGREWRRCRGKLQVIKDPLDHRRVREQRDHLHPASRLPLNVPAFAGHTPYRKSRLRYADRPRSCRSSEVPVIESAYHRLRLDRTDSGRFHRSCDRTVLGS